mgnify:CR=1 FL=1
MADHGRAPTVTATAEFDDPQLAAGLLAAIDHAATQPWSIMEVCGGQTHTIVRHGIDQLLPERIRLVHGPGCPVCVTPVATIDRAVALARRPEITLCTFGDMVRVPGSDGDLARARAEGGDVRVVYSPLDAVAVAEAEPHRQVVFLAVGFETTAPANATAVDRAHRLGLANFSLLVSHVLVPPAIEAIMADPASRVDAFLAAGHVCTVMGTAQYQPLAARHRVPIVVTGFEPLDVLDGIRRAVLQLEEGRAEVENAYTRAVRDTGNDAARAIVDRVFELTDRTWRGIGVLPDSGWRLRRAYCAHDAEERFGLAEMPDAPDTGCRAGDVLRGTITPAECPEFGTTCTPRHPLGAPMVSSEGACAAYHRYRSEP